MAGRAGVRQRPRWEDRAASAVTPADRLAVARDRFTAALARLRRPQRDPGLRAAARAEADRLAIAAADFLADLARQAEGW